jgi:pyruvate dehydrogenase E2 component (dihydrolipoamide acetyltransferase)
MLVNSCVLSSRSEKAVNPVVDVKMPQLGETVAEGTVTTWFKNAGDTVVKGEALFEVSTDKIDTEIPAQASGVLAQILVGEGETVDVGTVVGVITTDDDAPQDHAVSLAASMPTSSSPHARDTAACATAKAPRIGSELQLSPAVRKLLQQHALEPTDIKGTGPGGRLTKDDVLQHVASAKTPSPSKATATQSPVVRRLLEEHGIDAANVASSSSNGRLSRRDVEQHISSKSRSQSSLPSGDEVIPFSRIRKLTADHMVRSKATSAHTLMVREVDYEIVERVRRRHASDFKTREGFSLTYLPFIATAALLALRDFPHLNASVGNDELIVHRAINLGIAVDINNEGLVVPVIRDADGLRVRELARAISEKARDARDGSLGVDDFSGGTFTITNPGPFGTLMTGAIINQPQVAILSTDGVSRRPVVVIDAEGEESIAIHSTGLLALTFDHRAVDGAYAARFLQRVAERISERKWASRL